MPSLWLFLSFMAGVVALTNAQRNSSIFATWYTSWHSKDFPLENVSWSKYTHLIYAFATTTPNISSLGLVDLDQTLLPKFVNYSRSHNVVPMLSIGGYTGSRWFSSHMRTSDNRTAFVKTLTDVVQKYNLGGIEIDWEFPNSIGIGCNLKNSNDTTNFLSFLQQLRNTTIGKNIAISSAVGIIPWLDSTGHPSKDLSSFTDVLDFVAIMSYDVASNISYGAGPSSPLDDSCAPLSARNGSVKDAVSSWTSVGFPANQIVLGVPSYGHSFSIASGGSGQNTTTTLPMYPSYSSIKKRGDKWDAFGNETDVCGAQVGSGGTYEYWGLIDGGFLTTNGAPQVGITYRFDNCSQTPFVYNTTSKIYVSYENTESFAKKGEYIRTAGLSGFAMWEAGGDYNDSLLDSIIHAVRTPPSSGVSPSIATSAGSRLFLSLHYTLSSGFFWFFFTLLFF